MVVIVPCGHILQQAEKTNNLKWKTKMFACLNCLMESFANVEQKVILRQYVIR